MARVYAAEDSPVQALYLRRILERDKELEITFFEDGLELYLEAFKNPPDLFILDIILPTLSGMALLRLLKYDAELKKIPIIICSSVTESDLEDRLRKMRVDDYVPKPFKPDDLLKRIRLALEE